MGSFGAHAWLHDCMTAESETETMPATMQSMWLHQEQPIKTVVWLDYICCLKNRSRQQAIRSRERTTEVFMWRTTKTINLMHSSRHTDITAFIQTYGYYRKIILISLLHVDKKFYPPPPSLMSSLSFESTDNMRRSKFNTYSWSML